MPRSGRATTAVLLSVLLLASAITAGGVAVAQESGFGGAEDVYVTDDGDVIAVMAGDGATSDATAEYGVSLDDGLGYLLVESDDAGDGSVTGEFSAAITQSAMRSSGNLTVPRPDPLQSLSLDIEAVTNRQETGFDGTLSTTISNAGMVGALLQSASTSGSITSTADRFQADGEFDVNAAMGLDEETGFSFSLREQADGYTIEFAQDRTVPSREADRWRSREAASQRLQRQVDAIGVGLGGEASVSLDRYSFQETGAGDYRLDMAATIRLSGVDERLEQVVASQVAATGELSAAQAERLANDLTAVTINEVAVSVDMGGGSASGSVTVDIADYDDLVLTYFDLAEELGTGGAAMQGLEQARQTFEAQRAADLTYEFTWDASVDGGEAVTVDAEVHQDVSNWGAYVDERESRDLPFYESRFDLGARTAGDDIEMEGSAVVSGDRMLSRLVDQMQNASDLPPESEAMLRGFKRADLEKAKMEASLDRSVRLEAGARFENPSVFDRGLAELPGLPVFDTMVGRTEAGGTRHYVRMNGAVSADASESAVRELAVVGPDTTVHMPATWDREFPEMDEQRALDFLQLDEEVAPETASGSGPGFGVIAALVGLLAAALLATRRAH